MRRNLATVTMLALVLGVPAAPGFARDPGQVATEACQRAAESKARHKYHVDRAQSLGRARLRQVSNAQTGVSGKGQLDTSRGWVPYSYSCVYNIRSGHTGNVSVKSSYSASSHKSGGADEVVGALVGAAIAGAILNSVGDGGHGNSSGDSGWWSPASGVKCNSYQSACYKNGQFNAHWTHRIYQ